VVQFWNRDSILAGLIAIVCFANASSLCGQELAQHQSKQDWVSVSVKQTKVAPQEYYELRIYRNQNADKQAMVSDYLEDALVPALKRMEIDRIGVFKAMEGSSDFSMFVLIPFQSMEQFGNLNDTLEADETYQAAAKDYFDRPLKDPAFDRIESRFMKAFEGMPVIETSDLITEKQTRMFELRLYKSHTEDHARRKVAMFNDGEIDVMRDVKMGPVFYGSTLVGSDCPNLIYMLSAANPEEHKVHWQAFLAHPKWDQMKKMEIYKDTVSGITNWMLSPTDFSDL